MERDIDKFEEIARKKNISDPDKMLEETKKLISKVKDLEEKHKKVVLARGEVIEASVKIENIYNEIITKTGGEDIINDFEKGEIKIINGLKEENELGNLRFNHKTKIIKDIMMRREMEYVYREYIQSDEWKKKSKEFIEKYKKCAKCNNNSLDLYTSHKNFENFKNEGYLDIEVLCVFHYMQEDLFPINLPNIPEPPLIADLNKITEIRDIFAHVPINWLSDKLEFDDGPRYKKRFFSSSPEYKSLHVAVSDFMSLQKEILNLLNAYTKSIALSRNIIQGILFGDIGLPPKGSQL